MTEPSARILLDSISPGGHRLTTMEVVMHRFVLAEFNTHRVFSRNSASSRAIPFSKMLERVKTDPAIPVKWAAEQAGMQGGDEIENTHAAKDAWLAARNAAVRRAENLANAGVHKSICNRLLEPFLWHTVIVSSTEWQNFFKQRCSPLAQPEMRAAAEAMYAAYESSFPHPVDYEDWHTPLIQDDEELEGGVRKYVSVARCARVSYLTHDGKRDISADLQLYRRLVDARPPHASPLEHVARPLNQGEEALGNFAGWQQLRHLVLGA